MAMTKMGLRTVEMRDRASMRMILRVAVLALMATTMGWAQAPNSVVEAHAVMATDAAHANSPVKLAVLAQVAPGYHINDHKPTLDYLIPTELKVQPSDQFTVKSLVYPKGTPRRLAFSNDPLSVYEGSVVIGALLQAGKTLPPGTYTLQVKLAYQACSDHACLPPKSVPMTVTVKVVPANVPLKRMETDVFKRIKFE